MLLWKPGDTFLYPTFLSVRKLWIPEGIMMLDFYAQRSFGARMIHNSYVDCWYRQTKVEHFVFESNVKEGYSNISHRQNSFPSSLLEYPSQTEEVSKLKKAGRCNQAEQISSYGIKTLT